VSDAPPGPSAFAPSDWLPVQEGLLRGLNHALSNRLASLGALSMLLDGAGALDATMRESLASDVQRLEGLLELYRAMPAGPGPLRRPGRVRDAVLRAAELLGHHPDHRDVVVTVDEEPADAEPVRLLAPDPLRAGLCLLMAVVRTPGAPEVTVGFHAGHGEVEVRVQRALAVPAAIAAAPEYAALARFATAEDARLSASATADGARLSLYLPGLSRSRAART
jgi:hypothetical protein